MGESVRRNRGGGASRKFSVVFMMAYAMTYTGMTFTCFPYSYRNTSGSLGEREIEVGSEIEVFKLFQVLPNFHTSEFL